MTEIDNSVMRKKNLDSKNGNIWFDSPTPKIDELALNSNSSNTGHFGFFELRFTL